MFVVAVPLQKSNRAPGSRSSRSLELIQGTLLARKLDRQAPWLGNLHRIADGSLVGLGVAVVGLSTLTLHWQGRWTSSFQSLEATQRLEHRLQESAAVLEQHHLSMTPQAGTAGAHQQRKARVRRSAGRLSRARL